jgi:hypothetical protein
MAVAVAAAAGAHHTAPAEELAVTIAGAEATRTTTLPANHVAVTMPATGLRRFVAKRLPKQATAMASARLRDLLLPEKFKPLGITKYDVK